MRKFLILLSVSAMLLGGCKVFRKKKDCLGCPKWSSIQDKNQLKNG